MADTVLVTGAGGFIGGRLAQRLALDDSRDVRPLVHRYSGPGSMRLARLPVDIEQGSVTDRDGMADVVRGCDAIVHCAVGNRTTIIEGTRSILDVAIEEGVDTFIHMSSAAVHGHDIDGVVREESPYNPDTSYGRWKVQVEHDIETITDGTALSPTVIRPYIVYGPYSEFVADPIEDIKSGAVLAEGGDGQLNQIYVDNLIDAIILAMETPAAEGETFLLRDEESITWRRYYEELGSMLDDPPPFREVSRRRIRYRNTTQYAADSILPPFSILKHIATSEDIHQHVAEEAKRMPWAMGIYARLPDRVQSSLENYFYGGDPPVLSQQNGRATDGVDPTYEMPSQRYAKLHSSGGQVSNRKAKELLGWEQRVTFTESIDLVEAWAEFAELV